MKKYYAGIGSRETPKDICHIMTSIASVMSRRGYTLRTGGAIGADKAFEAGAGVDKEIFLSRHATSEAWDLTAKHHPAWIKCTYGAKLLHARNAMIILGSNLKTPVEFVICWTPNGLGGGGTGQGIRIANAYGIEVRDLGIDRWREMYEDTIKGEGP